MTEAGIILEFKLTKGLPFMGKLWDAYREDLGKNNSYNDTILYIIRNNFFSLYCHTTNHSFPAKCLKQINQNKLWIMKSCTHSNLSHEGCFHGNVASEAWHLRKIASLTNKKAIHQFMNLLPLLTQKAGLIDAECFTNHPIHKDGYVFQMKPE